MNEETKKSAKFEFQLCQIQEEESKRDYFSNYRAYQYEQDPCRKLSKASCFDSYQD